MEQLLRDLSPQVLGVLVRRGGDFAAAEDAVQEALLEAVRRWPGQQPDDPKAWLIRVAQNKLIDAQRSETARRARERKVKLEPAQGPTEHADDTLLLLSRCCHPALTPASAIALTLRAVGGLTTAQIARAFLVPESTMAQRISRAKRTVDGQRFDRPGDIAAVLKVLYLIFNEGFTGEVDLAEEAIRLTRQLVAATDDPEVDGLLALMLLHHARRAARHTPTGAIVPLTRQDRTRWDTAMIQEGVDVLQGALAREALGPYQAQAAIAALHDDAPSHDETDWPQVLEWYDELARIDPSPLVALNRTVALAEVDGPLLALKELARIDPEIPRHDAVAAYLHAKAGDLARAADLYARAASRATSTTERDHLTMEAARLTHRDL
ncbi:RNA polymerase sigma factor [Nocardioides montaniterrae]